MSYKKLTFKKDKQPTGLSAIGHPHPTTFIKRGGKEVGAIYPPSFSSRRDYWQIAFMVIDAGQHGGWKWIFLSQKNESEQAARDFIKARDKAIQEKFILREVD